MRMVSCRSCESCAVSVGNCVVRLCRWDGWMMMQHIGDSSQDVYKLSTKNNHDASEEHWLCFGSVLYVLIDVLSQNN